MGTRGHEVELFGESVALGAVLFLAEAAVSEYQFDKGVPLVLWRPQGGQRRAKLLAMDVGDSFAIDNETDRRGYAGMASTLGAYGLGKWAVRRANQGGWRCWRLQLGEDK